MPKIQQTVMKGVMRVMKKDEKGAYIDVHRKHFATYGGHFSCAARFPALDIDLIARVAMLKLKKNQLIES